MIKQHAVSLKNAITGLIWVITTQRNFKIHLILSFLAVAFGFILKISYYDFLIILVLVGCGLAIEAINTAIEETIDAIHKDWSPEIKIAKDVSAAAVLIFAIFAFIIAWVIFIPKIF